ncbi:MAG: hypothetical protein JO361_07335 [Gammaproteobacteria bacterium]|nr:hypothetical protein [Gammaproteobacteria bacterium]
MTAPALAWYRHLWPWLIIALLASAVLGSAVSAWLAVNTTDTVLEHRDASE